MRLLTAVVIGTLLLSACVSGSFPPPPVINVEAERSAQLSQQRQNCTDYGFQKNTEAFATCMQNEMRARSQPVQQAQLAQNTRPAFQPVPPPPLLPQPARRQRINCMSNSIGTTVYTDCQ